MEPKDRPYVDPATAPGDQGTEPWAEGEPPESPDGEEPSPADEFTDGNAAGLDQSSADKESDKAAD